MEVFWAEVEYLYKNNNSKQVSGIVFVFVKAKDVKKAQEKIRKDFLKSNKDPVFFNFIKPYNELWSNEKDDLKYSNMCKMASQTDMCVFDTFYDYKDTIVYWVGIEVVKKNSPYYNGAFVYAFVNAKDAICAYHLLLYELENRDLSVIEWEFIKPYDIKTEWYKNNLNYHYNNLYDISKKYGICVFDDFYFYEKRRNINQLDNTQQEEF